MVFYCQYDVFFITKTNVSSIASSSDCPYRNRLGDGRLESRIHVETSQTSPDVNSLVTYKQCQFSNSGYFILAQW